MITRLLNIQLEPAQEKLLAAAVVFLGFREAQLLFEEDVFFKEALEKLQQLPAKLLKAASFEALLNRGADASS